MIRTKDIIKIIIVYLLVSSTLGLLTLINFKRDGSFMFWFLMIVTGLSAILVEWFQHEEKNLVYKYSKHIILISVLSLLLFFIFLKLFNNLDLKYIIPPETNNSSKTIY